jgi:hypothetical protein
MLTQTIRAIRKCGLEDMRVVLDRQEDNNIIADVTTYASGLVKIIKSQFASQVAAAMW